MSSLFLSLVTPQQKVVREILAVPSVADGSALYGKEVEEKVLVNRHDPLQLGTAANPLVQ